MAAGSQNNAHFKYAMELENVNLFAVAVEAAQLIYATQGEEGGRRRTPLQLLFFGCAMSKCRKRNNNNSGGNRCLWDCQMHAHTHTQIAVHACMCVCGCVYLWVFAALFKYPLNSVPQSAMCVLCTCVCVCALKRFVLFSAANILIAQ